MSAHKNGFPKINGFKQLYVLLLNAVKYLSKSFRTQNAFESATLREQ